MSLLRSSLMVSILTLLGSIISFGNQLIIAHFFGASVRMDMYLIAVSLPFLVSGTLSAVLSYSMVPALISYKSDRSAYGRFAGLILLSLLVASVLVFVCGYLTAPGIIHFFGNSLPPESRDEAVRIARVSWAAAACSILLAYLGTMHNAAKRFYVPVLAGMLPYVGMILFGIAAARILGPVAIAWGMLAGTFLGGLLLLKGTFSELNLSYTCFTYCPQAANYFATIPMIFLAMACFTAFQTIDAYWAPQIGAGNLSYLGYCQRILIAIGSLVIAGPAVVLVPRLVEAHLEGRQQEFLNDLGRSIRMVLVFAMPIAMIVSILAVPLIELAFQRGAFDANATRGVVSLLPIMMIGMVAMLCAVIMFRALYARQQVLPSALLGTMVLVLYFILSGILSRIMMVQGIALAYALSWWATLLAALVLVWRDSMISFLPRKAIIYSLQLIGAVILMSVVMYAFSVSWISPLEKIGYLKLSVRTGFIGVFGLITYYFAAVKLFMIPEALYVSEKLLEGFKGARA